MPNNIYLNYVIFLAVYADTKVAPLLWTPSPLGEMVEKFNTLKYSSEYQVWSRFSLKIELNYYTGTCQLLQ